MFYFDIGHCGSNARAPTALSKRIKWEKKLPPTTNSQFAGPFLCLSLPLASSRHDSAHCKQSFKSEENHHHHQCSNCIGGRLFCLTTRCALFISPAMNLACGGGGGITMSVALAVVEIVVVVVLLPVHLLLEMSNISLTDEHSTVVALPVCV